MERKDEETPTVQSLFITSHTTYEWFSFPQRQRAALKCCAKYEQCNFTVLDMNVQSFN